MTTYNLYEIVKHVLKSRSPKEYIKKIKEREFLHGYYLIEKEDLIKILEKTKSLDGQKLLLKINNNEKTIYELDKASLIQKYKKSQVNYFDIGSQLINYEKCNVKYLYDCKANIYFRAKDICNILEYKDSKKVIKSFVKDKHTTQCHSLGGGSIPPPPPLGIGRTR